MTQNNSKKKIMIWVETIFDTSYLLTVLISAGILYYTAEIGSLRWQYSLMAFTLGIGDAFHLIPRIYSMVDRKKRDHTALLGIGKYVTSLTMTLFYLFLWDIGKNYYSFEVNMFYSVIVYGLALLRVLLCVLPQNRWLDKNPPFKWGIFRNIPFFILGMMVMVLYMIGSFRIGGNLSFLWLAILISFLCYLPVVLYSKKNPKIGMLMLPKSCAYVAIVLMGFVLPSV